MRCFGLKQLPVSHGCLALPATPGFMLSHVPAVLVLCVALQQTALGEKMVHLCRSFWSGLFQELVSAGVLTPLTLVSISGGICASLGLCKIKNKRNAFLSAQEITLQSPDCPPGGCTVLAHPGLTQSQIFSEVIMESLSFQLFTI